MADITKRKKLEQLVEEILAPTPYELVLCEFVKAGSGSALRVYIDHEDGVTLDHCSAASQLLLDALESHESSELEYDLEVSSPGVDRPLVRITDFKRFLGERVYVKLHAPVEGRKQVTGQLQVCDDELITVVDEADSRSCTFRFGDIAKATLKPILKFS